MSFDQYTADRTGFRYSAPMRGFLSIVVGTVVLLMLFATRNASVATNNFVGWAAWQYAIGAVPFALIAGGIGDLAKTLASRSGRLSTQSYSDMVIRETSWPPVSAPRPTGSWPLFFAMLTGMVVLTVGFSSFAVQALPFNGIKWDNDHSVAFTTPAIQTVSYLILAFWWPLSAWVVYRCTPRDEMQDDAAGLLAAGGWGIVGFWVAFFLPAYT